MHIQCIRFNIIVLIDITDIYIYIYYHILNLHLQLN